VRALKLASRAGAALESSDDDDDAGSAASRPPSLPPSLPPSDDEGDDASVPPSLPPSLPPSMPPSDDEGEDEYGVQQMLDARAARDDHAKQIWAAADQDAEEKMDNGVCIHPAFRKKYGGKAAADDEPGAPAETQAWGKEGGETQAWRSGTQDDEEDSEEESIAALAAPAAAAATKRRAGSSPRPSRSQSPVAAAPTAKRGRILDSDDED
jgi:hypothetical protein